MKKLRLDDLNVDSFATAAPSAARGTVAAHQTLQCTEGYGCPESFGGTCWITCAETCPCTDLPYCG